MTLQARQGKLDAVLLALGELWHPQPFREVRPPWCLRWPDLAAELLALDDGAAAHLNDDSAAALALLERYIPEVGAVQPLADLPSRPRSELARHGPHWSREIPGRKRQQIEAFVGVTRSGGGSVIDWCGGKGHLGRRLALEWQVPVHTLELDPALSAAGESLASRLPIVQKFVVCDVLTATDWPRPGQHAVALHACGDLHRTLVTRAAASGVNRLDVAPCCYHRGVTQYYEPLSGSLRARLTSDDTRLAVTETVTASARLARQRDLEMAWKLGFDAFRRASTRDHYRSFKPVPAAWFRGSFAEFLARMAEREALPLASAAVAGHAERRGWERQREVMRLSIVRHAFRRALEVWLSLDLAVYLAGRGYSVDLGSFCERRLTPRNLLISAQRAG